MKTESVKSPTVTSTKPTAVFETERATYESHKASLLKSHLGKFALIRGQEVIGVFDSEGNALQAGYQQFGPVPLFIRQILPEEPTQSAPALAFGILSIA